MHAFYKRDGFTLIELLVVIAIIGLLSSTVLASLNSARTQARDARRLSDIRQIDLAMELYFDEHGHYPDNTSNPSIGNGWNKLGQGGNVDQILENGGYIPSVPADPRHGNTYYYFYDTVHNCTQQSGDPALLAVRNFEQNNHDEANCPDTCGRSWNGYCVVYPDDTTNN